MGNNKLTKSERNFLIFLGIPAFGIGLAYNLVTTYLPYFIERLSGAAITGMMISIEGVIALFIPFIIGFWSDSISTKYGKRFPFFFLGLFIISSMLIVMPFSSENLALLGIELFVFFIGFFTLYEAYYTFFPDLVPQKERGISQGIQGGFREFGLLLAMAGGGFLIDVWKPLPFLLFTFLLLLASAIFTAKFLKKTRHSEDTQSVKWYSALKLVKNPKIKLWLIANILWEAAFAAIRVFIVLYFTRGLSFSLTQSSGALALVGAAAIVAAPFAGWLADKYGHKPVILGSVVLFAIGLIPPLFTTNIYFVSAIMPIAFSAVVLMTLPFSILMGYLPKEEQHGVGAALYSFSQGVGALIGPLLGGVSVELFKNVPVLAFESTHGYSAIFLVASLLLFASVPFSIRLFQPQQ